MSDGFSLERLATVRDLSAGVARALASGRSQAQVVEQLVKQGWTEGDADGYVTKIRQSLEFSKLAPESGRTLAQKNRNRMIRGLVWTIAVVVVTAIFYRGASLGEGAYMLFWGAVILGIVDFLAGYVGWLANK